MLSTYKITLKEQYHQISFFAKMFVELIFNKI